MVRYLRLEWPPPDRADLVDVEMIRRALQQDAPRTSRAPGTTRCCGIMQEPPAHRQQRVDSASGRSMGSPAPPQIAAARSQQVAHATWGRMAPRNASSVLALGAMQQHHEGRAHSRPRSPGCATASIGPPDRPPLVGARRRHRASCHGNGDEEHRQPIAVGGKNLGGGARPVGAVRAGRPACLRATRMASSCQAQRCGVGQHVARIGDQGERAGMASDRLSHHEPAGQQAAAHPRPRALNWPASRRRPMAVAMT